MTRNGDSNHIPLLSPKNGISSLFLRTGICQPGRGNANTIKIMTRRTESFALYVCIQTENKQSIHGCENNCLWYGEEPPGVPILLRAQNRTPKMSYRSLLGTSDIESSIDNESSTFTHITFFCELFWALILNLC